MGNIPALTDGPDVPDIMVGIMHYPEMKEYPESGFRGLQRPTLACNNSYFQKKIINWDRVNMKVV